MESVIPLPLLGLVSVYVTGVDRSLVCVCVCVCVCEREREREREREKPGGEGGVNL